MFDEELRCNPAAARARLESREALRLGVETLGAVAFSRSERTQVGGRSHLYFFPATMCRRQRGYPSSPPPTVDNGDPDGDDDDDDDGVAREASASSSPARGSVGFLVENRCEGEKPRGEEEERELQQAFPSAASARRLRDVRSASIKSAFWRWRSEERGVARGSKSQCRDSGGIDTSLTPNIARPSIAETLRARLPRERERAAASVKRSFALPFRKAAPPSLLSSATLPSLLEYGCSRPLPSSSVEASQHRAEAKTATSRGLELVPPGAERRRNQPTHKE